MYVLNVEFGGLKLPLERIFSFWLNLNKISKPTFSVFNFFPKFQIVTMLGGDELDCSSRQSPESLKTVDKLIRKTF